MNIDWYVYFEPLCHYNRIKTKKKKVLIVYYTCLADKWLIFQFLFHFYNGDAEMHRDQYCVHWHHSPKWARSDFSFR